VSNVRRGRSGRRLLAIRTNERAAAALGISVRGGKIYAFGLAAGIAALGGVVIGYMFDTIEFSSFTNLTSINDVGWAFIGGIGYLLGPFFGAMLAPGSLGAVIGNTLLSGLGKYITLIGGIALVLLVLQNQN